MGLSIVKMLYFWLYRKKKRVGEEGKNKTRNIVDLQAYELEIGNLQMY